MGVMPPTPALPCTPSPFPAHATCYLLSPEIDPGVMRASELILPLNGCSTWESRPCTYLGNTVELALMAKAWMS